MTTTITNAPPVIELTPDQMLAVMEMAGLSYDSNEGRGYPYMRLTGTTGRTRMHVKHVFKCGGDGDLARAQGRDAIISGLFKAFLAGALYTDGLP